MNQNLQIVKVLATPILVDNPPVGCMAERGTVAADAAAVGDTVSSENDFG